MSLASSLLGVTVPRPKSLVSYKSPTSACFFYHDDTATRSFNPRLHGELCEEDGSIAGEGVRRPAGRVQGRAVHAIVGSQPFRRLRSHYRDHTCACSAADDSSEYVFLDLIYAFSSSFAEGFRKYLFDHSGHENSRPSATMLIMMYYGPSFLQFALLTSPIPIR